MNQLRDEYEHLVRYYGHYSNRSFRLDNWDRRPNSTHRAPLAQ